MSRSAAGQVSGEPTAVRLQSRSAMARPSSPPLRKSGSSISAWAPSLSADRRVVGHGRCATARSRTVAEGRFCQSGSRSTRPERECHHPGVDLLSTLPAFLLAVLLISASPGPAMALIFRRAALRGMRGAVPTVLGLELGLYCGRCSPAPASPRWSPRPRSAYLVLRVVGAAVLLYLGSGRCGRPGGSGRRPGRRAAPPPRRGAAGGARSARVSSCSWPTRRRPSS